MQQTPLHDFYNAELLAVVPANARRIVEVGSSSGILAREYKKINATCHYTGVEIDPTYAELSRRYCDAVVAADIEAVPDRCLAEELACDCWIFADTLEHLRDPWRMLARIRAVMSGDGCVVACIPNVQHWSVQSRLSCGEFRYEDKGLLDRTHLRWFTRRTIEELFDSTRFRIAGGCARIYNEPDREKMLPLIRAMAAAAGGDPDRAVSDALPFQYVVKAVPR
jgi:SAM-dependent methyltransferase